MPEGFYDQFKSSSSLSPASKINLGVNGSISGGVNSVKDSISSKLSLGGLSAPSLSSVSGSLDNLVGKLRSELPGFAQKGLERISPNKLVNARSALSGDAKAHAALHSPETVITDKRNTKGKSANLQYPPDLRKYFMSFGFGDYSRPSPYVESTWEPDFYIFLPLPAALVDATSVTLQQAENPGVIGTIVENVAGAITAAGPNASFGNKSTGEAAKEVANQGVGVAYTGLMELGGVADTFSGAQVTGTVGQLVGAVPNPHVNIFFQGVNLRKHTFSYRFAPKNLKESITISEIVKVFKRNTLPNYAFGAANVLGYPKIVQLTIEPNSKETMFYKKCMIESVNVNYSPMGTPSFFAGSQYPTHIEMQINLQEIEILTSQDYGGSNGDLAGDIINKVKEIKNKFTSSADEAKAKAG